MLLLLLAIAVALADEGTSPSPWTLPVVIALFALAASWFGVIAAILRFAADVGRFSTTVEHLQKSVESLGGKLDVLPHVQTQLAVHHQRLNTVESNVSELQDSVHRLGPVTLQPEPAPAGAGRRGTKGG